MKGNDHCGQVLSLATVGDCDDATGIFGYCFDYGATGMISLGESLFYFSHDRNSVEEGHGTTVKLYHFDREKGFCLI